MKEDRFHAERLHIKEAVEHVRASLARGGKTVSTGILDVFLKALTEHYSTDGVAPGIVTAWLPDRRLFYCSVRRYSQHKFALRSNVVVSFGSKLSANAAIAGAMRKWKQEIRHPRQSNLKLFMKEDLDDGRGVGW